MGWDQSTGRESVDQFLLRELDIDLKALEAKAISEKLRERGLTFKVTEDTTRWEGDEVSGIFRPLILEFSDGRKFVTALTSVQCGDDWGNDSFTFVEAGKTYELHRSEYVGDEDDPHDSTEIMQGVTYSLDEVREQGGEFGGAIADFFSEHGIKGVSFEPGEDDP